MTLDYVEYWEEMKIVLSNLPHTDILTMRKLIDNLAENGGKLWTIGNGGSASTAEHASCDLSKGLSSSNISKRYQAISLTSNSSLLTAWSNDTSYDEALGNMILNFANEGDMLLAISGSGNSSNLLHAIESAKRMKLVTIGLTGFNGGLMRGKLDLEIHINSSDMQIVENVHLAVIHSLVKNCNIKSE
jgi:D-sedoheptulose 7-phosphate isomerase